ncbi:MAG: radical SAM family heme chaperone HemW [Coriobacteriaceae bacterium]|jgi:oxygen-independent coproporphyrinogen-3 oxidase|nr:radical SAM family heme chaperone HemW [Coriobacteriaceae bacterium]
MDEPFRALYLHLPFCKRRCRYCDFTTREAQPGSPEVAAYMERLIGEARQAARTGTLRGIETVYLGGGTPSHLGSARLSGLLYALSVSLEGYAGMEVTLEANPESISLPLVKDIWALGVNRISIGVQSFNDKMLSFLGRVHSAEDARRAICLAQERFDNVSIDLMCGIPGQSFEDFQESLEAALALGIRHVSVYPLVIEEGTPLAAAADHGEFTEPDQDFQALMMQMAQSILEPAGLSRYEVASYAAPGFECRHNTAYWTGLPYLGLGDSAVTMTQDARRRTRLQDGRVVEQLDRRQMQAEDLMMAMRMTRGIGSSSLAEAALLLPEAPQVFHGLVKDGLLERAEGRLRPTLAGWLCGNELYGRILELAP